MAKGDMIRILNHSEYSFQIICHHKQYILVPEQRVELCPDDSSIEIELIQLPQTIKWSLLKILSLIFGLILAPILNLFLMEFPTFTDGNSPLLIHAKYLLKADATQKDILLRLVESTYDGQSVKSPKITLENADISLLSESYEINQQSIKDSIFYCIYNRVFLAFLGLVLITLALINIHEIAIKILLVVIFFPLLLVPIISTIISARKQKKRLYERLASFTDLG